MDKITISLGEIRDFLIFHFKQNQQLIVYYNTLDKSQDIEVGNKMLVFDRNLDETWKQLMKIYNCSCVYDIPKDIYDLTCLELGIKALNIWEDVHNRTQDIEINRNIVKMKLWFYAQNSKLIGQALEYRKSCRVK